MNAIAGVLADLHTGERHLATELIDLGQRHRAEQDVFHITKDLAAWSEEHVSRLAQALNDHGEEVPADPARTGLVPALRLWASEHATGDNDSGLLLLQDLELIYLAASFNSLCWELLAQGAQALKDRRLLALSSACHPETLRQLRWANTKLKESAPQALSSES